MAATSKKKKATRKKAVETTGVSQKEEVILWICLLYTSPSPRDRG